MNDTAKRGGWMREEMPNVAAIIDEFRAAFGAGVVDRGIRQLIADGEYCAMDHVTGQSFGARREPIVLASGIGADGMRWVTVAKEPA